MFIPPPYILMSLSSGATGISTLDNRNYQFGTVVEMYSGCGSVNIGESILFFLSGAETILINNSTYFLVDERKVFLNEGLPL